MVVFADFQCNFSSDLFFTLQGLKAKYPNLRITYKETPLAIHPEAPLAHRAALAAGRQGKYDAMAELLYANQQRQDRASLLSDARRLHLDIVRFRRDLDSPAIKAELARDLEESHAFAIEETPTLYLGGKSLIGAQSLETLSALIEKTSALQSATAHASPGSETQPALAPDLIAALETAPSAEKGSATAPLTIVEFTDFQCPFCRSAVGPLEEFIAGRGRDVRWVFRSFPLDFHPDSELANEAALAAGEQGQFWPMHDLLFSHQSDLKLQNLRAYADQLHLDMAQFDAALTTHRFAGQIASDRALGLKAGVDGTPTFVIDGKLLSGVRSLPELNQIADAHLATGSGRLGASVASVGEPSLPEQQILGPTDSPAPVTLTWYVDVRSALAGKEAALIRSLGEKYDGKVRVLFRAFPVETHADGRLGSAALVAALKMARFWEMYHALSERRDVLDREKLLAIATAIGLDPEEFAAQLDNSAITVSRDVKEAARRGIQGAPVVFVNQQRVDGLQREDFYSAIVESELKTAPAVQANLRP